MFYIFHKIKIYFSHLYYSWYIKLIYGKQDKSIELKTSNKHKNNKRIQYLKMLKEVYLYIEDNGFKKRNIGLLN